MKYCVVLFLILAGLLAVSQSQKTSQPIYMPYSTDELRTVEPNIVVEKQHQLAEEDGEQKQRENKKHRPKHGKPKHEEIEQEEQFQLQEELTEEEIRERKAERKRYNKIFRVGLIIGTGVLAFILVRFCIAKRRRCHRARNTMIPQQPGMPVPVNAYSQPRQPQQIHFMQPQQPQSYPQHQQPQMIYQAQPMMQQPVMQQPVMQQPVVRGRPHDSYLKEREVNPIQEQINFHENEILRLRNLKKQKKEMPINTSQSLEPIYYRDNIPVGQPLYNKDANSSFASEYPQI